MTPEPVLELDDIQGNIFPGFKKDSQHFLFFRITNALLAKAWLKNFAVNISTAKEVLSSHALWKQMKFRQKKEPDNLDFIFINCALAVSGFSKLGTEGMENFDDQAFAIGMESRSALLGDPLPGSRQPGEPGLWKIGAGPSTPDILIIVASDDKNWASLKEQEIIVATLQNGMELIHIDQGRVRPGAMAGHEHFGFKDGISFPALRGRASNSEEDFLEKRTWPQDSIYSDLRQRYAAPGRPLVWPGHFLFGYNRQERDSPELERPRSEPTGPFWAKNGSFLVYRRLNQDVSQFHKFLNNAAKELAKEGFHPMPDAQQLGALLVGRWSSGWPVARDRVKDQGSQPSTENYFTFSQPTVIPLDKDPFPLNPQDDNGSRCPFAAHIRKVNPRDDATDLGPMERTFQKLLLRRGITFGPEMDQPVEERGLLFVSYQSSITDQFEFIMNDWVNDANKPRNPGGIDPIIGAGTNYTVPISDGVKWFQLNIPGGWITTSGGCICFLRE